MDDDPNDLGEYNFIEDLQKLNMGVQEKEIENMNDYTVEQKYQIVDDYLDSLVKKNKNEKGIFSQAVRDFVVLDNQLAQVKKDLVRMKKEIGVLLMRQNEAQRKATKVKLEIDIRRRDADKMKEYVDNQAAYNEGIDENNKEIKKDNEKIMKDILELTKQIDLVKQEIVKETKVYKEYQKEEQQIMKLGRETKSEYLRFFNLLKGQKVRARNFIEEVIKKKSELTNKDEEEDEMFQ